MEIIDPEEVSGDDDDDLEKYYEGGPGVAGMRIDVAAVKK